MLFGLDGKDHLEGGTQNDTLLSGGGDDVLRGDDGNDSLPGGANADKLKGGNGNDRLGAGTGKDTIIQFQDNKDTFLPNDSLWKGDLSKEQVLGKFAVDTGKNLLLDFGSDEILA